MSQGPAAASQAAIFSSVELNFRATCGSKGPAQAKGLPHYLCRMSSLRKLSDIGLTAGCGQNCPPHGERVKQKLPKRAKFAYDLAARASVEGVVPDIGARILSQYVARPPLAS